MNILIAFKIYEFYPKNIIYGTIQDEESGKFSSGLFRIENEVIQEMLFSDEKYIYSSKQKAINSLYNYIEEVIQEVKILSN